MTEMLSAFSLLGAGVLLFVFAILLKLPTYKSLNRTNFSINRDFPYELFTLKKRSEIIPLILLSLSFLACICVYIPVLIKANVFPSIFWELVMIMAFSLICFICLLIVFLLPISLEKLHINFAALGAFSFILATGISVIISIDGFRRFGTTIEGVIGLIMQLLGIFITIFLLFDPHLKDWAKLDKNENSDGTATFSRPSFFRLAFYEWVFSFLCFSSLLGSLLSLSFLFQISIR